MLLNASPERPLKGPQSFKFELKGCLVRLDGSIVGDNIYASLNANLKELSPWILSECRVIVDTTCFGCWDLELKLQAVTTLPTPHQPKGGEVW